MLTRSMALRVLLADENVTIKKVFQLTLQDYAVEVTTVNVGVDVAQVAATFKPDIIFADVILQKKNGYDVCRELKNHPQLSAIPVILIWSGFMELDHGKYKAAGADDNLEKPFDAQKLRSMVNKWVSKTKSQSLSEHLSFPKLPDFVETPAGPASPTAQPQMPPPPKPSPAPTEHNWTMDSFAPLEAPMMDLDSDEIATPQEPEEFLTVRLPTEPPRPASKTSTQIKTEMADEETENPWVQKSLSKYKIPPAANVPQEDDSSEILELDLGTDQPDDEVLPLDVPATKSPVAQLSEKQLEDIIRAQSKEVIEKVVWQIVPEIATRVIEREIQRLLSERTQL